MPSVKAKNATNTARILVVGCGNTLRGDDGLGPFIVEQLARRSLRGVQTRIVHQLTPELAAELADADAVVFVDASLADMGGVHLRPVHARRTEQFTHSAGPESLLAVSSSAFGRVPRAWVLSVAGKEFAFQEGPSSQALENALTAVRIIEELVETIQI